MSPAWHQPHGKLPSTFNRDESVRKRRSECQLPPVAFTTKVAYATCVPEITWGQHLSWWHLTKPARVASRRTFLHEAGQKRTLPLTQLDGPISQSKLAATTAHRWWNQRLGVWELSISIQFFLGLCTISNQICPKSSKSFWYILLTGKKKKKYVKA